ncbi:MAG: N-acetylmuramoyl-L-alanine amidase [Acidobacteria bacterium]|nr:N-acetylmuramoyl-L-alanine amidase [Acidobacteriota bacterium]
MAQDASKTAPTPVTIRAIRFWSLAQSTRIAIETSGETRFKYERLHDPERLFVDVLESKSAVGDKAYQTIKVGDSLVRQIRIAQKDNRVTRIVLDLEQAADHEITQSASPSRILVEIRTHGQPAETQISKGSTGKQRIEPQQSPAPAPPAARPTPATERAATVPEQKPAQLKPAEPQSAETKATESTAAPQPLPQPPPSAAPPPTEVASAAGPKPIERDLSAPVDAASKSSSKAAKPTSTGKRSLTRSLGLKIERIVIDAGHGGHDHGTTGPTGLAEKDLVLDVSLRLGALVEQRLGAEVIYTRDKDEFIGLTDRSALANQRHADLFLSIHANATPLRNISGAEVYYLNFTNSKDSLDVAARENAGHGKSISELKDLVQKIALTEKLDESKEFAARIQAPLATTWARMDAAARNRGVKKAPFVVLIGAAMPAILAEIGFISNPRDEALLKKPDQRQRIAEALFKGIQQYASGLGQTPSAVADSATPSSPQSAR